MQKFKSLSAQVWEWPEEVHLFDHICIAFALSLSVEESEPRTSCWDQAQQPGQKAAGEQAEETKT